MKHASPAHISSWPLTQSLAHGSALRAQSDTILVHPMDCSLPGSCTHAIFLRQEYWGELRSPSPLAHSKCLIKLSFYSCCWFDTPALVPRSPADETGQPGSQIRWRWGTVWTRGGHIGFRMPDSKDVLGFLVTLFLAVVLFVFWEESPSSLILRTSLSIPFCLVGTSLWPWEDFASLTETGSPHTQIFGAMSAFWELEVASVFLLCLSLNQIWSTHMDTHTHAHSCLHTLIHTQTHRHSPLKSMIW